MFYRNNRAVADMTSQYGEACTRLVQAKARQNFHCEREVIDAWRGKTSIFQWSDTRYIK